MTQEQEDWILFERKKFKKTVEEIYFSLENQIANLYPLKIYRCLARYGLSVLPEELIKAERRIRKFRKYAREKRTKKIHPFDKICQQHQIQHRTIKFKHPWTNGMVERFNGKVKTKVFRRYLFNGVDDLKERLTDLTHLHFLTFGLF